jgi:hypothetical protein
MISGGRRLTFARRGAVFRRRRLRGAGASGGGEGQCRVEVLVAVWHAVLISHGNEPTSLALILGEGVARVAFAGKSKRRSEEEKRKKGQIHARELVSRSEEKAERKNR